MTRIPNGLSEFLIKAKINTYASNKDLALPSRPKSKDIHFEEGAFKYIDTYLGSLDFIGQEAVWYHDESIWGMNYIGRMLVNEIPVGFLECLKNALKEVPFEAPFRGPDRFQFNQYEYNCNWTGDVSFFKGSESILFESKEIYSLRFHGGVLK